jgi:hypothetical protein
LRTGLLDALIRTGDINLVENVELRAKLITHDAEVRRFGELTRLLEDIAARISDIRTMAYERHRPSYELDGSTGLNSGPDFSSLRTDVEYRGSVRRRVEIQGVYANILVRHRAAIEDLLGALELELARF